MVRRGEGRVRRIVLVMVGTAAGVVLLFSYRTSLAGSGTGTGSGSGLGPGAAPPGIVKPAAGAGDSPGIGPSVAPSATGSGGGSTPGTETVNGTTVFNGYGPVQVQVRISGGKIVDVSALALPPDGHSQQINSYAVPRLRQEVLRAQSARVDAVSGATDTSMAYTRSLQAALDAAHLGG